MSLEIIWESDGVVRRFYNAVTEDDVRRAVLEVHSDSRFPSLRYSINDFLAVTAVLVAKSTIASAALRTIGDSKSNDCILVAIVATSPEVTQLAQFYASPAYLPYPAKTFSSLALAREWIASSLRT